MSRSLSVADHPGGLRGLVDHVTETSASVGVAINCLGVTALFDETRLYEGMTSSWVLTPAPAIVLDWGGRFPIPLTPGAEMRRLLEAGLNFPVIYVADEVPSARLSNAEPSRSITTTAVDLVRRPGISISPEQRRRLVGPPPLPGRAMRRSEQLGSLAMGVFAIVAAKVPVLAGVAVGAALAPLAVLGGLGVDPIVFGAVPLHDSLAPGMPAAFFELARWTWD